jgi:hypothetical protein
MQEIQSILTNRYSTFSHFAIDQEVLSQWVKNLSHPITPHSLMLENIPKQIGLERSLDILLLSHILPQQIHNDTVIPRSFEYARVLSNSAINGIYLTDFAIINQLDKDDIIAIFNLFTSPDEVPDFIIAFDEYKQLKKHIGSVLNLLNETNYKLIDVIGTFVQTIPSLQEIVPITDMEVPFHSSAFSIVVPTYLLLCRDGNISPDISDLPSFTDRVIIQVLYSSGLFGSLESTLALSEDSKEYAELMACSFLALHRLSDSLDISIFDIQQRLHSIHSGMLQDAPLSLSSIRIGLHL